MTFNHSWPRQAFILLFHAYFMLAGACTCVLGPNAAGKTTMIQCLTGALPVSGGEVLILGQSNQTAAGLAHVRAAMGVCPQFDILFEALTGREHLLLFAAIKGIPRHLQAEEACRLLDKARPDDPVRRVVWCFCTACKCLIHAWQSGSESNSYLWHHLVLKYGKGL